MEITKDKLEEICVTLTEQLNLNKQGLHIAAIFQDNNNNEIIGWGICDSDNNICVSYDDLEILYNVFYRGELKNITDFYKIYCDRCGSQRCDRSEEWKNACPHYKEWKGM